MDKIYFKIKYILLEYDEILKLDNENAIKEINFFFNG